MCFLKPVSRKNLHPRNERKGICSSRSSFPCAPISPTLFFISYLSMHKRLRFWPKSFPFYLKIFATVGDKHEGGTHILYDPTLSERGALVCVARAPRKKSVDDFQAEPVIHNPHALPLFRDQPSRKRQREKVLKDPLKSHKPELPITGPGFGGRVGSTKGSLLTQYLLKVISLLAMSYIIYNMFK